MPGRWGRHIDAETADSVGSGVRSARRVFTDYGGPSALYPRRSAPDTRPVPRVTAAAEHRRGRFSLGRPRNPAGGRLCAGSHDLRPPVRERAGIRPDGLRFRAGSAGMLRPRLIRVHRYRHHRSLPNRSRYRHRVASRVPWPGEDKQPGVPSGKQTGADPSTRSARRPMPGAAIGVLGPGQEPVVIGHSGMAEGGPQHLHLWRGRFRGRAPGSPRKRMRPSQFQVSSSMRGLHACQAPASMTNAVTTRKANGSSQAPVEECSRPNRRGPTQATV